MTKVESNEYGTLVSFMNDGTKFIKHNADLTQDLEIGLAGAQYFNHAVDLDKDGRYEIFVVHHINMVESDRNNQNHSS